MNYFHHLLLRLKARGITPTGFIDAGAHFGETNDTIRSIYPGVRVVSFEANPNCEPILKQKGIEYLIGLLGRNNVESVPFFINPNDVTSTGCSVYKETGKHFADAYTIDLPMWRLDAVVPVDAKMDFLKMDVQGAEIDILEGATDLLPTIKWVYLEVSFTECNQGAPQYKQVADYLYDKGYHIADLADPTWVDNKMIQCNFLFER